MAPLESLVPSSPFGLRTSPLTGVAGEFHWGQDFAAPCGTRVYSADAGVVRAVGWHPWGGGNRVEIDHGNGLITTYNHLEAIAVKKGDSVRVGEVIARVGTTGSSTGCHLHFETILNGSHTDPRDWTLIPIKQIDQLGPIEMTSYAPDSGKPSNTGIGWAIPVREDLTHVVAGGVQEQPAAVAAKPPASASAAATEAASGTATATPPATPTPTGTTTPTPTPTGTTAAPKPTPTDRPATPTGTPRDAEADRNPRRRRRRPAHPRRRRRGRRRRRRPAQPPRLSRRGRPRRRRRRRRPPTPTSHGDTDADVYRNDRHAKGTSTVDADSHRAGVAFRNAPALLGTRFGLCNRNRGHRRDVARHPDCLTNAHGNANCNAQPLTAVQGTSRQGCPPPASRLIPCPQCEPIPLRVGAESTV